MLTTFMERLALISGQKTGSVGRITTPSFLPPLGYSPSARESSASTVGYLEGRSVPTSSIDPLEHDRVQLEIGRRKALDRHYSSAHIFSSRVICGDCGGFYGRKVWHSTDAYKNYIWQCNEKYRKQQKCRTPHLKEDELKRRFVYAYNQRAEIKEETLAACRLGIETICVLTDLDEQIRVVTDEISVLVEMSKQLIEENSQAVHDQDEYQRRHSALVKKYTEADNQLKALQVERSRRIDLRKSIECL